MRTSVLKDKQVFYHCNAPNCNFRADNHAEVEEHIGYDHHYYPVKIER